MALIAHWPLNGNTNDYSGNQIQNTTSGTISYVNNGKTGKALSSGNIILSSENTNRIFNSQTVSYTFWYKPLSETGTQIIVGNNSNRRFTTFAYPTPLDLHMDFRNDANTVKISVMEHAFFTLNEWTHVSVVYDSPTLRVYKNGVLSFTKTGTFEETSFNFETTFITSHSSRILNDMRFYNHALTEFEIQEIYKTKIMHYTFDHEVESTTNLFSGKTMSIYNNHSVPGSVVDTGDTYRGYPIYRSTMTPNTTTSLNSFKNSDGNQGVRVSGNTFVANLPHTSSILWRVKQGPTNMIVRGTPSNISGWTNVGTYVTEDGWNRTITTRQPYTTNASDSVFWSFRSPNIELNETIIIDWAAPQLETKDHPTEYTATSRDRKQISDLSGFGNHGNLTGDLEITKDSVIGNGSIIFDSTNAKINISTINPLPSEVSISFWRKTISSMNGSGWLPFVGQSTSHYIMATTSGTGNFYHSGNVGSRTKNIYIDGVKIGTTTPPVQDNNWHHYVITGLDLSAWTQFNINGYSSSWNMLGNMDDFRMYSSTLTDRDIKDLYETRVEIDENSTLYAKDFSENVNLLNPDIFYSYANSGTVEKQIFDGRKVWVPYPSRFHPNGALRGLFKENTRYKIHLVFTHFSYYSTISDYVHGGLTIRYTDGTEHHLSYKPSGPNPDWRTFDYITTEGKTVSNIWVYYYVSSPVYISEESYMVEYSEDGISNKGITKFLDYSTIGITDGLIAYYPFNNNTIDYSGKKYIATEYSAGSSPIINSNNIQFETGDGLKIENIISDISNKAFTFIIKAEVTTHGATNSRLAMGYPVNNLELNLRSSMAGISLKDSSSFKGANYTTTIPTGEPLLYTATFDGSTLKYYHDGVLRDQVNGHLNDMTYGNNLLLGNWTNLNQSFQGKIYYVKIFNRALTEEEIKIEYNTMFKNEVQIHENGTLYAKEIKQY